MPRQKDLKRLVRARMQKTGEAYTTARAQLIHKSSTTTPASEPTPEPRVEFAALAGMSDEKVQAATGCEWERWVYALDRQKAWLLPHREIAKLVQEKYKVGPWWGQSVTVGYERIKGLRAIGQRRNGTYEASKSRTFDVPVDALYHAWSHARVRAKWLTDAKVRVRTATPAKSMRLDWPDGGIVVVAFTDKGDHRSTVTVTQAALPDRETADRVKREWAERLDALKEVLES